MKPINVLFVMPQMGMGGSERLVHTLALKLDRNRFNPSVAWLYGNEVLREFKDLRIPLHYIPKKKRIDFQTMRALRETIEANSIDVVNAQHFMPAIYSYYGCKMAANKALISTTHSRWEVEELSFKWRAAGAYLMRRMDALVGVAPDVSNALREVFKGGASHAVTIENGVDIDRFSRRTDNAGLRASLGFSDSDLVIGIVANLKKVKNHLFLLQAFALLAEEFANARLLVVGQGFAGEVDNTERDLRLFVDNQRLADKVLFLGYRTDIQDLLNVMDVFCLVSLREGLPIGVIEAMAMELPLVGTKVEGIRDVVAPNEDGILVELGDVGALKTALADLARDEGLRARLGRAGRQKALSRYSLKRCVQEYEKLFLAVSGRSADR